MTQDEMAKLMTETFERLQKLREQGQKEYAHQENNAFRNFESLSKELDLPREKVLWIYLKKHLDGILSYLNGHKSQRESVLGRIDDAQVYLELLRGMIWEDELLASSIAQSNMMNIGTQGFGLGNASALGQRQK